MIKKPTKQLYNLPYVLAACLVIPLLAFFVYATLYQPVFFLFLITLSIISLGFLFYSHIRLVNKQAEISLREQDYLEKCNLIDVKIVDEKGTIEALKKKIVSYNRLRDLTQELSMDFSLEAITKRISLELYQLFGPEENISVLLYLFHSPTGELGLPPFKKQTLKKDWLMKNADVYDKWVIKSMKPLLIEDARKDFRFDVDKITIDSSRAIRSLMCAPMISGNKMVGVIRLDSLKENYFNSDDVRLLTTISDLGAIALENAQLYERIENLAIRDGLTGLFLRRYFFDILNQKFTEGSGENKDFSLLMLDLDYFKEYNDSFGHTAGDIVLKAVGEIIETMFKREDNLLCRYGGEEFLIYLEGCSKKEALQEAETIRAKIEEKSIVLRRRKTNITVSIGVVTASTGENIDLDDLIHKVDQALYKAKKKGRNRVSFA